MPQSLSPDTLRLVPLGGLGEIGMNCMAIEQADGLVVVDCGTTFPHDDLGVDVIHPDFTYLIDNAERVRGIFLTHGHEDHIGAVPYLLRELDVPVFGPPHALGLVERRLAEHGFRPDEVELRRAVAGETYEVGPFRIEPVRVSHSIVEASALCIETAIGTVVHTGDFNLDPDPPDGEPTDVARLQQIGERGVKLLLSDSTNVDVTQRAGSERGVAEALRQLVRHAEQRVVICMFASNIQRLMMLGDIAEQSGRRICLLGRSLSSQVEVARRIGRLYWPSHLVVSPEAAQEVPRNELLVLAGGTQAERNSAMRRIALGTHQHLSLEAGDEVAFSSRIIPGNERPVFAMMADLLRRGVRVHTRITSPDIHTSGHAGRSEQTQMIEWLRPEAFVPVHGTLHHLLRHGELARELGVPDTLVVENGTPVLLDEAGLRRGEVVPHGRVSISYGGEPLGDEILRRRADMARYGFVAIALGIDDRGRIKSGPAVVARGVPGVDDDRDALEQIAREVSQTVARVRANRGVDVRDEVRRAARRRLADLCGTKPVVEVELLEL